jgi:hypothetical protein
VFVAAFYKAFTFGGFRPTSAGTVTTVTIYERETSTQEAVIGRKAEEPIQSHSFRSDGLLEVNPNGRHPIYDLIERAEAEWDKKMKRQSRTLDEAVVEYKRRYRRAPPKGFDEWWVSFSSLCVLYKLLLWRVGGYIVRKTTSNYPMSMIGYTTIWNRTGEWIQWT